MSENETAVAESMVEIPLARAQQMRDQISALRHSLSSVLDWADRHRISYPEHDHDCFEEWCAERDYARILLAVVDDPTGADS